MSSAKVNLAPQFMSKLERRLRNTYPWTSSNRNSRCDGLRDSDDSEGAEAVSRPPPAFRQQVERACVTLPVGSQPCATTCLFEFLQFSRLKRPTCTQPIELLEDRSPKLLRMEPCSKSLEEPYEAPAITSASGIGGHETSRVNQRFLIPSDRTGGITQLSIDIAHLRHHLPQETPRLRNRGRVGVNLPADRQSFTHSGLCLDRSLESKKQTPHVEQRLREIVL